MWEDRRKESNLWEARRSAWLDGRRRTVVVTAQCSGQPPVASQPPASVGGLGGVVEMAICVCVRGRHRALPPAVPLCRTPSSWFIN
jgi:hypothetical protein